LHRVLTQTLKLPLEVTAHTSSACQSFILTLMRRRVWHRPTSTVALAHPWLFDPAAGYPIEQMELPTEEDPALFDDATLLRKPPDAGGAAEVAKAGGVVGTCKT
jgi:hypothetical protein